MSFDYIAFHAAERPRAVALVSGGREITYAQFRDGISNLTRALHALGRPRGSSVAVASDDIHIHWLLLLACERLGLVSASFPGQDGRSWLPLLARTDFIFYEPGFLPEAEVAALGKPHQALTRDWLAAALALTGDDAAADAPAVGDEPVRLVRTSGTTGSAKRLHMTRSMLELWIGRWIWYPGLGRQSRLLLTLPANAAGGYAQAAACLRAGGTAVGETLTSPADAARAIADHAITHVTLLPIHLKQVLDELPTGFRRPPSLTVTSFGASISPTLRERALACLATELSDLYGCNEVGFICAARSTAGEAAGAVLPGVTVEVVDDHERPLPLGQAGRIRAKTPCMAAGYIDDPEATARMFRDGWFYPGDVGVLTGPRHLRVIGRGDHILNIGGGKFAPELLEEQVLLHAPVGDVGICALPNALGVEELHVGVARASSDDQAVLTGVTRAFRDVAIGQFHVTRLPAIPRNVTGKIQRDELKRTIAGMRR
jgi:acyl-coenzyme A synthetase/AMP-(fatty) acid ligase